MRLSTFDNPACSSLALNPSCRPGGKVAMLGHPPADDVDANTVTNALLMGTLHCTIPVTAGLCLRVVACEHGSAESPHSLERSEVRTSQDMKERKRVRATHWHWLETCCHLCSPRPPISP